MVQTKTKLTFADFLQNYPDGSGSRYLVQSFYRESDRLGLDYIVDKDIVIRTVKASGQEQGRNPDVGVVKASVWNSNALGCGALIEPIQLAVEVTSTNWEDDYVDKLDEYQRLGIAEYWIVDYLAIASRAYLGNPKVPTVFVYSLENDRYAVQSFRNNERIISKTFPELEITVEQIVLSSQVQTL
ncbi:MAG: Uma2 family endonuclease [Oscillatoriales cyanobacterium]|nr:MAG: Uma2 family endonuclease [Oscillatoriales cyanobacterium]